MIFKLGLKLLADWGEFIGLFLLEVVLPLSSFKSI